MLQLKKNKEERGRNLGLGKLRKNAIRTNEPGF